MPKCPMKPLSDHLIVRRDEAPTHTPGGIALPGAVLADMQPTRGTVLAVGPGRRLDNGTRAQPEVDAGDQIVFARYGGAEIEFDGETFTVLREGDVIAVLKE